MTLTGPASQHPTLWQEDTPANHSHPPDTDKVNTTHDTSGPNSPEPFAYFDPDTQSWKMLQGTFLSDSETYSKIWPRSGMTADGIAYQLPPSAPLTAATACSSLPTPRSAMGDSRNSRAWIRPEGPQNLENWVGANDPDSIGRTINPVWVEWLMGFPPHWTDLEPSETPLSHKSQNTSDE